LADLLQFDLISDLQSKLRMIGRGTIVSDELDTKPNKQFE